MSELLLGVDIGTSSSKGVLACPDAEEVWWADFASICRELLEKADDGIAAVCASGIGACVLPADGNGNPLRPAILYGIDRRATRESDELTERYGADEILSRCGSPLSRQAVGLSEADTDWSRISATVEPDAENREVHDDLYGIYRELYPATREQPHRLAEMQRGGGDVVT